MCQFSGQCGEAKSGKAKVRHLLNKQNNAQTEKVNLNLAIFSSICFLILIWLISFILFDNYHSFINHVSGRYKIFWKICSNINGKGRRIKNWQQKNKECSLFLFIFLVTFWYFYCFNKFKFCYFLGFSWLGFNWAKKWSSTNFYEFSKNQNTFWVVHKYYQSVRLTLSSFSSCVYPQNCCHTRLEVSGNR